jgi:hypothetical protein
MSTDIKAETICDHKIVEDVAFLNDDMQTINISRRVAVSKSLSVKRNGFLIPPDSPQFGYYLEDVPLIGATIDRVSQTAKRIKFNKPLKSQNDFFELSYITAVGDCPKCEGSSQVFDFAVDSLGRLVALKDNEKLMQDISKGVLTQKGSNPYHPWYGTSINALIGSKLSDFQKVRLLISQEIQQLVNHLKDLQNQQSDVQDITDKEMMEQLISVQAARPDPSNPSFVTVSITYRNRAGNVREIQKTVDQGSSQIFGTAQDKLKGYK